jgi:hypothetical protein
MQINLQGFLDKNTQLFVLELWKLLISAQTSLGGIPQQFLDITKAEILKAKVRHLHMPGLEYFITVAEVFDRVGDIY